MTEEAFYDYALYLSLREFLRVRQGLQDVQQLDASYSQGRRINQEAILRHPIGAAVAEMGRAFHEGAVLPGWSSETGVMDWNQYATFVGWFASLNPVQRSIAISRIREGSETPWAPLQTSQTTAPECSGVVPEKNLGPSIPGGARAQAWSRWRRTPAQAGLRRPRRSLPWGRWGGSPSLPSSPALVP